MRLNLLNNSSSNNLLGSAKKNFYFPSVYVDMGTSTQYFYAAKISKQNMKILRSPSKQKFKYINVKNMGAHKISLPYE